jgi:hypothetical protein
VDGAVSVATTGSIAQSGTVTFNSAAALSAGAVVTLEDAANQFAGVVTLTTGGNVSLVDVDAIDVDGLVGGDLGISADGAVGLGDLRVTGDLTVVAHGDIMQSNADDVLYVGGDTTLTANDGTTDYNITLANRVSDTQSVNDFIGNLRITSAAYVDVRALDTLRVGVNSSTDVDIYADEKLYLLGANVAGTLSAVGNFDMTGDITAQFIDFYSDSYLNMNGYAIRATATGSDGYVNVIAEGDITLGHIESPNGDIYVESKTGRISDGLLTSAGASNTQWNIKTSGIVSVVANEGNLNAILWSPLYEGNAETADDTPNTIDIAAFSVNQMEAPDGVTVTVGQGVENIEFTGDLNAKRDVVVNLGSANFNMAEGTTLSAEGDIKITTTGSVTLSKMKVTDGKTIDLKVGGNLLGHSNADGSANLNGSTISLDVGGSIGTSDQAVTIDAQTTVPGNNGVVKFIATPSDAYLEITTPDNGNNRRTVEIGSDSDDWVIGDTLDVTATDADLDILGNISAASVSITAEAGAVTMTDGKTITSDGDILLSGSAGLAISNIIGDTTAGSAQVITLRSDLGNISELTANESANIITAGALVLDGQSIAVLGSGDLDVNVGTMDITTTSGNAGVANIESLSSQTVVNGSNVTGILTLTVDQGDLTLAGDLSAGGIMFNLADSSAPDTARDINMYDGVTLSSLGAATLLATGDVLLSDINVATGDLTIAADGVVNDNSAGNGANVTMGTGELSILSKAMDLTLSVSNIKSLTTTETDTSATPIDIISVNGNTRLEDIATNGKATFQQTAGNLTLTGSVFADDLDMDVLAGNLAQEQAAAMTITNGFDLTASGSMALSSISSQEGDISITAGGALTDASPTRETSVITTSATDATVTIQASQIGSASEIGEVEIKSSHVESLTATAGGIFVELKKGGDLGATTATGDIEITQTLGSLTLTDSVTSSAGAVKFTTVGGLTMGALSTITARDGAVLDAQGGDLALTSVTVTGLGPDTAVSSLSASGDITDVMPWVDGPSLADINGWNVNAQGLLSLSGTNLGLADQRLNIRSADLSDVSASGQVYMAAAGTGNGTVTLGGGSATDGLFDLKLLSDSLLIAGSIEASTVSLVVDDGTMTMEDGIRVAAYHDMDLIAAGDIALSQIQTTDGTITIDAGDGQILDNSDAETSNIIGLTDDALAIMRGDSIGEKWIVDDHNVGDIDLNIAKVSDLEAGAGGIYLDSIRALEIGDATTTGEFEVRVTTGDLTLSGDQSGLRAILKVTQGGVIQQDGVTLITTGIAGTAQSGNLTVTTLRDINLSTMKVQNGDVTMVSELGMIEDGTLADAEDRENLIIVNGQLVEMNAKSIGTKYENGDIDIDALDIDEMVAFEGGIFAGLTGRDGELANIVSATATAEGQDIVITSGDGMLKVETVTADDDLSIDIAGETGVDSLTVGTLRAGGDLTLSSAEGNILQIAGTDVQAKTTGALTTLGAGGDITLTAATNDFADLTVETGADVHVVDASAVNLFDVTTTGDFALETQRQIAMQDNAAVHSGGDVTLRLATGNLISGADHEITSGNDVNVDINSGDWTAITSSTITAGRDVLADVVGNIDLRGTTSLEAGRTLNWVADNAIVMQGTTTLAAVTGDLSLVSRVAGEITMSGTSTLTSGADMLIDAKEGDLTVSDTTSMLADQGDLQIALRDGQLTATGKTQMAGDGVAIDLQTADRSVSLSGTTTSTADQTDLTMDLVQGDITLAGKTTMTAKSDVIAMIDQTGDISASGVTVITATDDNVMLSTQTGDMSFRDKTTITSGTDTVILINEGDLSTQAATTVTAGNDIRATLLDGFVRFSDRTILDAQRNVVIAARNGLSGSELSAMHGANVNVIITEGAVTMLNSALVDADDDVAIEVGQGHVWMQDAETLIRGQDVKVTVETGLTPREGSIWLDRIEGDQSVLLRALDGRILDNTAAQDDDLIVTHVMALEASDGIGLIWEDNLNTDADHINAFNSRSGGINIQNRTAFTIGNAVILPDAPSGLVNYGEGDIALVSPGVITHGRTFYGVGDPFDDGSITNLPGQGIFLVHNLSQPFFWEQQGDATRARISTQFGAPENVAMRHLQDARDEQAENERRLRAAGGLIELNRFDTEGDAFSRLLERLSVVDQNDDVRSIRKSREVLNITPVEMVEDGSVDPYALIDDVRTVEQANSVDGLDLNSGDLDAPLLPYVDALSENDAGEDDRLDQRPVLQSALALADDNLDAPLIAAE